MSAVSAESPRGSADLTKSSASSSPSAAETPPNGAAADFGPNQWLVDEMYQRYLADPGSVDQAWGSFFADYHPRPEPGASRSSGNGGTPASGQPAAAASAQPAARAAAPQPAAATT